MKHSTLKKITRNNWLAKNKQVKVQLTPEEDTEKTNKTDIRIDIRDN